MIREGSIRPPPLLKGGGNEILIFFLSFNLENWAFHHYIIQFYDFLCILPTLSLLSKPAHLGVSPGVLVLNVILFQPIESNIILLNEPFNVICETQFILD